MDLLPINLWPLVIRPLSTFPMANEIISFPNKETIHLIGLANFREGLSQYILFGKTIDWIIEGNIPGSISCAGLPFSDFLAKAYLTPLSSLGSRSSKSTPLLFANPIAALVGFPLASKA